MLNLVINKELFQEWVWSYQLRKEYVIVTLTTTPNRIKDIKPTIDSILAQSYKPDAFYINIPNVFKRNGSAYEIPEWLKNNKHINILRTKDYGPATKLLGVLEQVKLPPEAIIVTIDDDASYPKNLIVQLAHHAMQYKNSAVGISGADISFDKNGNLHSAKNFGLEFKYLQYGFVDVLQGFGGNAYRRSFFDNDIFREFTLENPCFCSDDIYINWYLKNKNISRLNIYNKRISARNVKWFNALSNADDALHLITPNPAIRYKKCLEYLLESNS